MANVVIGSLQIRLSAATAEFNANIQAARKGLKRFRKSGHEVATGGIALASFSRALLGVGRAAGEAAGALSGRRRLLAGPGASAHSAGVMPVVMNSRWSASSSGYCLGSAGKIMLPEGPGGGGSAARGGYRSDQRYTLKPSHRNERSPP